MNRHHRQIDAPHHDTETANAIGGFDGSSECRTLGGTKDWGVRWTTLQGGMAAGLRLIELCNGPLKLSILPTRGMGIWKADYRGIPVGWESPVRQPVHPRHVELQSRHGLGWLDGFQELLCRCGLASNGPPGIDDGARSPIESQLTLHGKIANLPAHTVEAGYDADDDSIWVRGIVDECTMFGPQLRLTSTLSAQAGTNTFTIEDEIRNLASTVGECQLLYHLNVGAPFLGENTTFHSPHRIVCPRDARAAEGIDTFDTCLAPTPDYAEQVYYFSPLEDPQGESLALLTTADRSLGLSVRYDARQLPCLSLWKCTHPEADGYVTGIEPGTNYPNFKSFERKQGRVVKLLPDEVCRSRLAISVLTSQEQVEGVLADIAAIQGEVTPLVHRTPVGPFAVE